MPDVSLVLALHREGPYLARTLASLSEAAAYARAFGISTELVAVLDRPDAITEQALNRFDPTAFDALKILPADHGSLGPTRNDGCRVAEGTYIFTADGDDLISFNTITEMFHEAERRGPRAILIPNFILAFGSDDHVAEFFDLEEVTPLALLAANPFVSRIFSHRSLFAALSYQDVGLTDGYAYEDWHFNCEAVAQGYSFHAVADTFLFYRKRFDSLLNQGARISVRQIPPSRFFQPDIFQQVCGPWVERIAAEGDTRTDVATQGRAVLLDRVCLELLFAAHRIEPAIVPDRWEAAFYFNYLNADMASGIAYYRLCERVADRTFDEVFLLPFLTTGGADRYVLDIINELVAHDPQTRILILFGERFERYAWLERLPSACVALDLFAIGPELSPEQHDLLCLKLLQSCAPNARLHLRSSVFAQRFFARFAPVLSAYRPVFYRFSDGRNTHGDIALIEPSGFQFVAEHIEYLDLIVCDNAGILAADQRRLRYMPEKWKLLYARIAVADELEPPPANDPGTAISLLWASRLDTEKRPTLLVRIAQLLADRLPEAVIDAFGRPTLDEFDVAQLIVLPNIRYHGAFNGFAALDAPRRHCLIYTSRFDGMPNVPLEAAAAGLPIIAPDVGGIGELIRDGETGLLLRCTGDDAIDAERYLQAILMMVGDPDLRARLRQQAFALVRQRHAPAHYRRTVQEILALQRTSETHAMAQ